MYVMLYYLDRHGDMVCECGHLGTPSAGADLDRLPSYGYATCTAVRLCADPLVTPRVRPNYRLVLSTHRQKWIDLSTRWKVTVGASKGCW